MIHASSSSRCCDPFRSTEDAKLSHVDHTADGALAIQKLLLFELFDELLLDLLAPLLILGNAWMHLVEDVVFDEAGEHTLRYTNKF